MNFRGTQYSVPNICLLVMICVCLLTFSTLTSVLMERRLSLTYLTIPAPSTEQLTYVILSSQNNTPSFKDSFFYFYMIRAELVTMVPHKARMQM